MYGLLQAGIFANHLLKKFRTPHGYEEVKHTPRLWRHNTCSVTFLLVVDDFRIKYIGDYHVKHLIYTLRKYYTVEVDVKVIKYVGIDLDWNYINRNLDIDIPKYIPTQLHKYQHPNPSIPQHAPYLAPPRKYRNSAQEAFPEDISS